MIDIEKLSILKFGNLYKIDQEKCKEWQVLWISFYTDKKFDLSCKRSFNTQKDDPVLLLLDIEIEKPNGYKHVEIDHLVFFYNNAKCYIDTSDAILFKELVVD